MVRGVSTGPPAVRQGSAGVTAKRHDWSPSQWRASAPTTFAIATSPSARFARSASNCRRCGLRRGMPSIPSQSSAAGSSPLSPAASEQQSAVPATSPADSRRSLPFSMPQLLTSPVSLNCGCPLTTAHRDVGEIARQPARSRSRHGQSVAFTLRRRSHRPPASLSSQSWPWRRTAKNCAVPPIWPSPQRRASLSGCSATFSRRVPARVATAQHSTTAPCVTPSSDRTTALRLPPRASRSLPQCARA